MYNANFVCICSLCNRCEKHVLSNTSDDQRETNTKSHINKQRLLFVLWFESILTSVVKRAIQDKKIYMSLLHTPAVSRIWLSIGICC